MSHIAIIGAGPSGLKAAEILATAGHDVTIYDQKPSPARKFLMAGRGGLNITHSEPLDLFVLRYGPAAVHLFPAIQAFPPEALRAWCATLGEDTFIGSSGRVFPRSFKASPLLRAWMIRLANLGVKTAFQHRWDSWDFGGRLIFGTPDGEKKVKADAILLALGGASWPKLGSDAKWIPLLTQFKIQVNPFHPTNCGFETHWSPLFQQKFAGQPLKNITISHQGRTVSGEMMITAKGVEGGGIYALSSSIRGEFMTHHRASIVIDLKPDWTEEKLAQILSQPRGRDTLSNFLRKQTNLSPEAIGLLMEDRSLSMLNHKGIAKRIKHMEIHLHAIASIERAISSSGGIPFDEITPDYMLKKCPGIFVAGEMLDWEAPTGGYLLQACFSTGVMAANGIIKFLNSK